MNGSKDPIITNLVYLSEWIKILFFILIVASNLFFFVYWIVKMMKELRSMMIKKMEKIYLFMCLCMNRAKLERHKVANQIEEENEILREDYMKCILLKLMSLGIKRL